MITYFFRVSEAASLINSHIYVPECIATVLTLPGLCNCGMDNGCGRLTAGRMTRGVMFDTPYTFACTNTTVQYVLFAE